MKPLGNKVLIEPIFEAKVEAEKKGLALPEFAQNVLPWRGKVLSIGDEIVDIKVGQTVIFDRFRSDLRGKNGHKFVQDDKEFYLIPYNLVLAIIE